MGHIILGSDTPIGSSIVRLLASLKTKDIIAASPSGSLPKGVDPKKVEARFADVIDPFSLSDLFKEGDIVYNCQVISDERVELEEADLYNSIGFVNLLGVATSEKVARIVCAFPQSLGQKLPEGATEDDYGQRPNPTQVNLRCSLEIAKKYINGEPFGWKKSTIEKFTKSAEATANFVPISDSDNESSDSEPSDNSNGPSAPSAPIGPSTEPKAPGSGPSMPSSSGPSLGPKAPSSGPSISSGPSMPASSGPSLGPKAPSGPSLGPSTQVEESEKKEQVEEESQDEQEREEEQSEIEGEVLEGEEKEEPYDPVPLVIARVAKLFGPFDPDLTDSFCRAIRLQRIKIVGSLEHPITWINPIDAGRAMIILGDSKKENQSGEYLVNGFIATPKEILQQLDRINHSQVKIRQRTVIGGWFRHIFNRLGRLLGFNSNLMRRLYRKMGRDIDFTDKYYYHKSFNHPQVFDDSKTKEEFNWSPKFPLEQTAKEALNWFTSHQL